MLYFIYIKNFLNVIRNYNRIMNYYKNNIKTATAYQRDSTNRTASEKILDKHFKDNMQKILEVQKQLIGEKPKKKVKIEKNQEQGELSPQQVVQKILKHLNNENKVTKCIQLLNKFLDSENFQKLSSSYILCILLKLNKSSQKNELDRKARGMIINTYEIVEKKQKFITDDLQIFQILKMYGMNKNNLFTDDTFQFNKCINSIQKEIQNLKFQKQKIDQLQQLKQFIKQQDVCDSELQILKYISQSTDNKIIYRRKLIFSLIMGLFGLATVTWIRAPVEQFLKKFNINNRQEFLNKNQKKEFTSIYQEFVNKKIKVNLIEQKYNNVDKQILSTPLNSLNQVKDSRATILVDDGTDRWAQKQNSR